MGFQKLVYCAQNSAKEKMLINKMQMTKEEFKEVGGKMTLLGRMTNALDIAAAILHFASDAAGFATGAELLVDGGQILKRDQKIFETVSGAAKIVFDKT